MAQENKYVQYRLQGNVATIRIDDGKRNALSPQLLREIYQALDQAESDHAIVILTGGEPLLRPDIFDVARYGSDKGLRMVMATNGTLITEATAVQPRGRISLNDLGLWDDAQVEPLARMVRLVQAEGAAIAALSKARRFA